MLEAGDLASARWDDGSALVARTFHAIAQNSFPNPDKRVTAISLINDALLASGKPALGFLNPWLYKKGYKGLTDVKKGFSYGCNVQGFPVTEGWDPVTGFGTPDFPKLVKLAGAKA